MVGDNLLLLSLTVFSMDNSSEDTGDSSDSDTGSKWDPIVPVIMVVVTLVGAAALSTVVLPAVGLEEPSVSTSVTVIDDTSEENTYYVQPTTDGVYSSLKLTFETTQSVYVDVDRSENVRVTTLDNDGINPNEMYTAEGYNSESPPEAERVYNSERPPYMQLVKVEVVDPSEEALIFVSATGDSSKSVAVQSWTIPPESQRDSRLPQIDVEENRLEIFPSGYF